MKKKFFFIGCLTLLIGLLAYIHVMANEPKTSFPLSQENIAIPKIPVGLLVTSLHDLDFSKRKYSMTAWIWGTYDPKYFSDNYTFSNHIEIVNARSWAISDIEHFVMDNPDGTKRSMTKFSATFNQNWNISYFPFDRQVLKVVVESVKYDSSRVKFVPDKKNSSISNDFNLSGWYILPIDLSGEDYVYPTTFGNPTGEKGVYSRIILEIPIKRQGWRIFTTIFLGFFVSYIIISLLVTFKEDFLSSRVSLIFSALFASIGNKLTVDALFPPQSNFTFSDLIQITTFIIVAIGLLNTIAVIRLINAEKQTLAYQLDYWVSIIIIPVYPIIITIGLYFALNS